LAFALSQTGDFRWRLPGEHPWEVGRWERLQLVLLAQPTWRTFRTDFAVIPINGRDSNPLSVVVEVDGRDYHEKTGAQAEHDRSRDRLMTAQGTAVFRFTGSEVWRNPQACAEEMLACASRLLSGNANESN
jgi:very-short-patch-repair endonuclease